MSIFTTGEQDALGLEWRTPSVVIFRSDRIDPFERDKNSARSQVSERSPFAPLAHAPSPPSQTSNPIGFSTGAGLGLILRIPVGGVACSTGGSTSLMRRLVSSTNQCPK